MESRGGMLQFLNDWPKRPSTRGESGSRGSDNVKTP